MDLTSVILIILSCTSDGLICRKMPETVARFQTVQECQIHLSLISKYRKSGALELKGNCVELPDDAETAQAWAVDIRQKVVTPQPVSREQDAKNLQLASGS